VKTAAFTCNLGLDRDWALRCTTTYRLFLALDALVDLLTVHGNLLRRIHADSDLIAF
jgi:hypothetical protein